MLMFDDDDFPFPEPPSNVVPIREEHPPSYMDEAQDALYTDADETPLPGVVDIASWQGAAPHRRFIIPGWVVRGACGLLSGQEGVGKSLLAQQMATCAAIGRNFLGLDVEHVKAAYITCEDPEDELRRRQEAINKSLGVTTDAIVDQLMLVSLKGHLGNELGTFDQLGRLSPSPRFWQIRKRVIEFGANLVFLDNAAHFFTGNENARHDVAVFLGLLEALSEAIDGAVVLLAHPNKQHAQGNKQGNEYSGSTGWSAHVRNRLFLDWKAETEDGMPLDEDARILRKSKANYGKKGEEIEFRWHEWAFTNLSELPSDTAAEISRVAADAALNERFLACLDACSRQLRAVSVSRAASNYAPRVFAKMTEGKRVPTEAFEAAMERLLHLGEIANDQKVFQRPNRTWAIGLGRVEGRTNHAQTVELHKPAQTCTNHQETLHKAAQTIDAQTMHKPVAQTRTNQLISLHSGDPSPPIGGDLDDLPPSGSHPDEPPSWMDEAPPLDPDWRDNPILNDDWGPAP